MQPGQDTVSLRVENDINPQEAVFWLGPATERETHSQEEGSHSGKWDFFIVKLAWPVQVHWFRLEEFSYAERALFSRPSSCSWVATMKGLISNGLQILLLIKICSLYYGPISS